MKSRATRFALGAVALLAAVLGSQAAQAQTYPTRPIQVIVGFAAGSASDVVLRVLLERMSKSLGQPFVVENRPGAGGNIGMSAAAKAAPDGYTLVMGSLGPLAANRTLYRELGYDPDKDFEPISLFAEFPNLIVINAKLPINSLADLIAYAKARPKQLNYGSVGVGSSQHLSGALFRADRGRRAHARALSQHRPIHSRPDRRRGAARLPVAAERDARRSRPATPSRSRSRSASA